MQILLDRVHFSPGEIDGNFGENTRRAVCIYRETQRLGSGDRIDEALLRALVDGDDEPALVTYRITEEGTAGPFPGTIPKDFREMAEMKRLSYTSPWQNDTDRLLQQTRHQALNRWFRPSRRRCSLLRSSRMRLGIRSARR